MSGTLAEREAAWGRTWDRLIAPAPDEDERKIAAVERMTREMALHPGATMRDFALVASLYLRALEEGLTNKQEIATAVCAALDPYNGKGTQR